MPFRGVGNRPAGWRKALGLGFRILVSAGLIAFLVYRVDTGRLWRTLLAAHLGLYGLALVLAVCKHFIEVFRIYVLLRAKELPVGFWPVTKIVFSSTFLGNITPTSLGTEIFRAVGVSRHTEETVDSITVVVINRFVGLVSLLFLAVMSAILVPDLARDVGVFWMILVFAMPLGLVLLGFSDRIRGFFKYRIFARLRFFSRIMDWVTQVSRSFYAFRRQKAVLLLVFGLSIAFQISRIVACYLMALALDVHVSLGYFFIITPLVLLFTTLPLSVGGIGTREVGNVYFLGRVGVGATEAFSVSILWFINALMSAVPGLFFYLFEGFGKKSAAVEGREAGNGAAADPESEAN